MATQLSAGYSLENSIVEAYKDMINLYGEKAYISVEVKQVICKLRINIPVEKCIENVALRVGLEDVIIFAEVINIAKRSGGNLVNIVKEAADSIYNKIEIERELKIAINAKKYEQLIMDVVPLIIVLYVRLTCKGMLDIMYETIAGKFIMSLCFLVYIFALFLGYKIGDIEV